jgi:uncharacterized protein
MTACCCTNMEIFLNPFDILQIAFKNNMTTSEVIDKYVLFLENKETGLTRPILKSARIGLCTFNENKLCTIHDHRPLSCRLFPLARIDGEFYLQQAEFCKGLKENNFIELSDYLNEDEGEEYLKSSDLYHEVIEDLKNVYPDMIRNKYYYDLLNIILFDFDYFYNGGLNELHNLDKIKLSIHLAKKIMESFRKEVNMDKEEFLENLYIEGDIFIAKNIKK